MLVEAEYGDVCLVVVVGRNVRVVRAAEVDPQVFQWLVLWRLAGVDVYLSSPYWESVELRRELRKLVGVDPRVPPPGGWRFPVLESELAGASHQLRRYMTLARSPALEALWRYSPSKEHVSQMRAELEELVGSERATELLSWRLPDGVEVAIVEEPEAAVAELAAGRLGGVIVHRDVVDRFVREVVEALPKRWSPELGDSGKVH